MRAFTRLRGPDDTRYELVHGDLIGRLWCAAMPLDDGRVSEAHAMISLREQELRLIALRGGFAVDGRPLNEVTLRAGMEVMLARGLSIEVEEVFLPPFVLGLESRHIPRQSLPSVCSIQLSSPPGSQASSPEGPEPRLVAGYAENAAAWIWCTGEAWRLRQGAQGTRPLLPGDQFVVGSEVLTTVEISLAAAGQAATRPHGGVDAPLVIQAHFDTVHIHREGSVVAVLGGVAARIVSELVALGGPAHWTVLAGLLWPKDPDPEAVRSRFDVNLSRLRRKLKEARVRTDLIHTDGAGSIELLLYPHDIVEDKT